MFKLSFNPTFGNLVQVSFGDARLQRKFAVFDCWGGYFSRLVSENGIDYWFWSDNPPKRLEHDIAERELFNV